MSIDGSGKQRVTARAFKKNVSKTTPIQSMPELWPVGLEMQDILVIGKNSFLARRFLSSVSVPERYLAVSHEQAFDSEVFRKIGCVVNFAIHPAYRDQPYATESDIDLRIAQVIARSASQRVQYIFLSSRAVYGPDVAMGAVEDVTGEAASTYGRNKRITERRLSEVLGDRASLLRIGNVIGEEHGTKRRTFMAQALDRLVAHNEIVLDVGTEVCRDFLPDYQFVRILESVCETPLPGAMNVGSGLPISVDTIARWIIEGFGSGVVRVTNNRRHDEFWLDVSKLQARYCFSIDVGSIADHCRTVGARLPRHINSG
jgi:dTDP-4-dehydrorhamnose reductase/UDP-glucose 4-epimerase